MMGMSGRRGRRGRRRRSFSLCSSALLWLCSRLLSHYFMTSLALFSLSRLSLPPPRPSPMLSFSSLSSPPPSFHLPFHLLFPSASLSPPRDRLGPHLTTPVLAPVLAISL